MVCEKNQTSGRSLHLVKRKNGTSAREAHMLERMLRDAKEADFKLIEAEVAQPLSRIRALHPQRADLISSLKKSVPRAALRWMDSLSPGQIAGLRIASNRSLDAAYGDDDAWKRYAAGGAVITRTVLAYPNAYDAMPRTLEYEYDHTIRIIDTRDYHGEKRIAIVFDGYELYFDKDRRGNDIEVFKPTGKVEVVADFPAASDWLGVKNGSLLGSDGQGRYGQGRYVQRSRLAWLGNIFRSHSSIPELDGPTPNDVRARVTLYARRKNRETFGLIMEAPEVRARKEDAPPGVERPQPPAVSEPAPAKLETILTPGFLKTLMMVVESRTLQYIAEPGRLLSAPLPAGETAGILAGVAEGNKRLQNELREIVRGHVGYIYQQYPAAYTVEMFGLAFWRLCDALGIPNEGYAGPKGKQ